MSFDIKTKIRALDPRDISHKCHVKPRKIYGVDNITVLPLCTNYLSVTEAQLLMPLHCEFGDDYETDVAPALADLQTFSYVLFSNVLLALLHFKPFRNELDHPPFHCMNGALPAPSREGARTSGASV